MNPLMFASWRHINKVFCTVMWVVAMLLTAYIIANLQPRDVTPHQHVTRGVTVKGH